MNFERSYTRFSAQSYCRNNNKTKNSCNMLTQHSTKITSSWSTCQSDSCLLEIYIYIYIYIEYILLFTIHIATSQIANRVTTTVYSHTQYTNDNIIHLQTHVHPLTHTHTHTQTHADDSWLTQDLSLISQYSLHNAWGNWAGLAVVSKACWH